MKASLEALRVWLTRPAPHDVHSARAWQARGATVLRVPTLSIEARRPAPEDVERVAALGEAWIVLPSPRAAQNLAAHLDAFPSELRAWPAAAVGEATAEAARDAGFDVRRVASRATGADLARELATDASIEKILLASSDRRRDELGDCLRGAGRTVVDLVVHWTVTRVAAPSGGFDVLAAYSPSALAFLDALDPAVVDAVVTRPVACLGETTADAARAVGFTTVLVPPAPGEEALLDTVAAWWGEARAPR